MFKESIFINSTRSDTIRFLKKFINQTYGTIVKEDSRRILWTYKYHHDTIECISHIISHGKVTEFTTTSSSEDLWNMKAKAPLIELYLQFQNEFKIVHPNEAKGKSETKPTNTKSKSYSGLIIVVIAIGASIIFYLGLNDHKNSNEYNNEYKTSTSTNDNIYITKSGFYGASSEENLDKFMRYINDQDQYALDQMFNKGKVFSLAPNEEVFVVIANMGTVKIRPKGMDYEMWTVREAIKKK